MLLSMTGYGKAKGIYKGRSYSIDIRTLNGKLSDLRLKFPAYLRPKEIALRKVILGKVMRGKMDCTIIAQDSDSGGDYQLNMSLIEAYLKQLTDLTNKHQLDHQDLLQTIIRIPNVIQTSDEEICDEEWKFVISLVNQAIEDLEVFRKKEGSSMLADLSSRVRSIEHQLSLVEGYEEIRYKEMIARIRKSVVDNLNTESLDENRLEQEIVYYLEKLDVHEEKVRLAQHCTYFLEIAQNESLKTGKKLSFISQEMGREINTLGSKAQYVPLQQIVVEMKVDLDQIKEQLANVL